MTSFRLTHTHTHTRHLRSARFFILRVTDSPATCSRWMASLSGFPFRLTPLMARTRSPMWMAPVLRGGEREREGHKTYPSAPDRADSPVRRPPFDHLFVFKCGLPTSRRHVALSTRAASPPPAFPHLSARPFLVRPEMTMGSKGSSVPEMVMPRGPL